VINVNLILELSMKKLAGTEEMTENEKRVQSVFFESGTFA
jgi:hypothetical protein